jgi:hypothetical protein
LWGDGVHDDAGALNALFARRPIDVACDAVRIVKGEYIRLHGGRFRIGTPLFPMSNTHIFGASFILDRDVEYAFRFKPGDRYSLIANCHIRAATPIEQIEYLEDEDDDGAFYDS